MSNKFKKWLINHWNQKIRFISRYFQTKLDELIKERYWSGPAEKSIINCDELKYKEISERGKLTDG